MDICPTLFVDNCVISTGYSDPARWTNIENQIGTLRGGNPLRVYQVKRLTPAQRSIMTAIQAIGNYAELGHILLYTYDGIRLESWHGFHSMRNNLTPLAAFKRTRFLEVPPPIDRSKFFQSADWMEGEELDKFIDFLLQSDDAKLGSMMSKMQSISDFELLNASKLSVFKNYCSDSVFGIKRKRDAYHYWAAECSGIDYFLTTDGKFLNPYRNAVRHKKIAAKCKAVSPEELIKDLNIPNSPISIPASGKMYLVSGHEYRK